MSVHADFDPLSEAFLRDPHARMRDLPAVFHAPSIDYCVVTRYADIERVFLDPETFSAANAQLPLLLEIHDEDPDAFDPERDNARRTLAFGRGIHFWVGSALGRLEASLALEELTQRFPDLRLAPPEQAIRFHPNISFRGPQALWVQA